jgi:hypothetical protein
MQSCEHRDKEVTTETQRTRRRAQVQQTSNSGVSI